MRLSTAPTIPWRAHGVLSVFADTANANIYRAEMQMAAVRCYYLLLLFSLRLSVVLCRSLSFSVVLCLSVSPSLCLSVSVSLYLSLSASLWLSACVNPLSPSLPRSRLFNRARVQERCRASSFVLLRPVRPARPAADCRGDGHAHTGLAAVRALADHCRAHRVPLVPQPLPRLDLYAGPRPARVPTLMFASPLPV